MKFSTSCLTAALAATASALPQMRRADSYATAASARVLMGNNGHIYIADYFPESSKFTVSLKEESFGDPSWMAFAPPNRLYAVDEFSAAIYYYELDLETNTLAKKAGVNGSVGVVHLEFNEDKTRMIGSAYGNGTVDVWNIENGGLELVKTIKSDGKLGPNEARQAGAHPHQANLDPSGRYFAVNDLGTDSILIIDSKDDDYKKISSVKVEAGCGPRHGVFYPKGGDDATHYMVVCEITNKVLVYQVKYTTKGLSFKKTQSLSTFGDKFPAANATTAAAGEIQLAPNNEDVYISNRLTGNDTDSIAHFKVKQTSCGATSLEFHSTTSSGGLLPRMFSLSDDAKTVFSANQDGKYGLAALDIGDNGKLVETPVATLEASVFGEAQFGPQFVLQIA
ncbi:Lactonase, 7-bladed beta-propeller-domain-containing protein [Dactylonectria estremocensis]|uniref:Lactonase, 7-bladed beta-propeller-domain-containing protein n=1 Tax=Dactylonectria estremocensis TaxID=1079267 RepID=A0A9P9J2Y4_9HYPO|nr:Lactonase, 7-bladed beta-propeller-domain-containing protein [Dactylonectria estremocensis]